MPCEQGLRYTAIYTLRHTDGEGRRVDIFIFTASFDICFHLPPRLFPIHEVITAKFSSNTYADDFHSSCFEDVNTIQGEGNMM